MKINKFAGLAVAVVTAGLLTACGDDGGTAEDGVRTVVVWDRAGAEATARQKFFEQWNKQEGAELGIRVQYEPQATEKYEEIVQTGFQTQRAPDVFHAPSAQMGAYVGAGWVQPLEGLVDDAVLSEAEPYLPDTSELVWGGKVYAIPSTTFTVRLVFNTELFRQAGLDPENPPETFSEVEQASRRIVESSGGKAFGFALHMHWVGFLNWIVDTPILATSTDLTQDGLFNMSTGQFEADRYAPIIEHYRTLIQDKLAYPGAESLDSDPMLAAFGEGKIGMVISSGSIVGSLAQLDSDIELGVGPIPIPNGATREQSPMNAGFPYVVSAMTEDAEASARVLEVLVGPEVQAALAEAGIPPLSEEAWDSPEAKQHEELQLFRPTELDQQWPKKPGRVVSVEGEDVTTTVSKLILDPSADVRSTLDELSGRYQEAYQKAVDNGQIDPNEFSG